MRSTYKVLLIAIASFSLVSCGIYSFTGASIPVEVQTISVTQFPNHAELVNPNLSPDFTEKLRDRFMSQTTLNVVTGAADWEVKGQIIDYYEKPRAANASGASLNQLTIVVNVEFYDNQNEQNNWEKRFARSQVFDGNSSLSDVEDELVEDIGEQLVNDIFNKIAVNW